MLRKVRVLLVDDHALIRAGIRALLENGGLAEVVGETGDGDTALALIENLRPEIVLLDLTMPRGPTGFEVLKISTEKFPLVRIIVLTVHDEEQYAFQALRAGAAGYLPKSAAAAELRLAIEHVMAGKKYLSPSIEQSATESGRTKSTGPVSVSELTPRQREVLTHIAEGHSTKDIARALNISVKTVETHRAQLMERLNIHDVASLVRYAIKMGLISIEERAPAREMGGGSHFTWPFVPPALLSMELFRLFLA